MKHIFGMCALLGAFLCLPASSQAVIIFTPGPGNFVGDENVVFNVGSLIGTGPVVQGITNQSNFIVNFSDAGEDLTTPSGGQARIEAVDGGLTAMKLWYADPNAVFQTLIWNLNSSANGSVTFTIQRTGGADVQFTHALVKGGQNFFRFEAQGESMITAALQTTVDQQDVRQIRIGGSHLVPEPTSIGALAVGALTLLRRRKR